MIRRVLAVLPAVCLWVGCSGQDDQGAHRAGQRLGETVTDFASGVGKGIDKKMEVTVELSEQVSALGLRKTIAKGIGIDHENHNGITVYFIASRLVKASLMAKALNAEGEEIGRSTVDVELAADDAKYVPFAFDTEMDTQLVAKYVVELKKPVAGETKSAAKEATRPESDKKN